MNKRELFSKEEKKRLVKEIALMLGPAVAGFLALCVCWILIDTGTCVPVKVVDTIPIISITGFFGTNVFVLIKSGIFKI